MVYHSEDHLGGHLANCLIDGKNQLAKNQTKINFLLKSRKENVIMANLFSISHEFFNGIQNKPLNQKYAQQRAIIKKI